MQPWLIAVDTVERLGSGGGPASKPSQKPIDLALTRCPGLGPGSLKGRAKREVTIVCAMKLTSSKEIHWAGHQEMSPSRSGGLTVEPAWRPYRPDGSWAWDITKMPQVPPQGGGGGGGCTWSLRPVTFNQSRNTFRFPMEVLFA